MLGDRADRIQSGRDRVPSWWRRCLLSYMRLRPPASTSSTTLPIPSVLLFRFSTRKPDPLQDIGQVFIHRYAQ